MSSEMAVTYNVIVNFDVHDVVLAKVVRRGIFAVVRRHVLSGKQRLMFYHVVQPFKVVFVLRPRKKNHLVQHSAIRDEIALLICQCSLL
jgi:hypothetical protein